MSSVSAGLSRSSPVAAPIPPQPPIIIAQGTYPSPRPWLAIPRYKEYSLIFPINRGRNQVLLGLKKRGFAQGIWNGFGGKPESGESMLQCASRELTEESDLKAEDLILRGRFIYYAQNGLMETAPPSSDPSTPSPSLSNLPGTEVKMKTREARDEAVVVHVYTCERWTGTPTETEEMEPRWFDFDLSGEGTVDTFPWSEMHLESSLYLPHLLRTSSTTTLTGRVDFYPIHPGSLVHLELADQGKELDLGKKTRLGDWAMGRWEFRVWAQGGPVRQEGTKVDEEWVD